MNWMDKFSRTDECVTVGRCKICRLLFADNLVLLAFSESGLQHALNGLAAACEIARMKIFQTEVLHLSRNVVLCSFLVGGVSLKQVEKFKYLGVVFMSDGWQDKELDVRSSKSCNTSFALFSHLKTGIIENGKLSVFIPILTYGHKSCVMTKRV